MTAFKTITALRKFLNAYEVDRTSWGKGSTKTEEDLFTETISGESELSVTKKGRLLRKVRRVQIRIFFRQKNGKLLFLIEKQVFHTGTVRERSKKRSASEKMLRGERPQDAALRCLKEELGITGIEPGMLKPLKTETSRRIASRSYPGLLEKKEGPRFKLMLPKKYFNKHGYIERQPRKTTYFSWRAA